MKVYGRLDMRGRFWCQRASRITNVLWVSNAIGRLVYAKETDSLWYGGQTEWKQITHSRNLMNNGQEMVFLSYPLPDNWTLKTTGINDRIILTDTNGNNLGSTGGSWIITGMNTTDGVHNHFAPTGISTPTLTTPVGASDGYTYLAATTHRHYMAEDGIHSHEFDGSWRPAHTLAITATYND